MSGTVSHFILATAGHVDHGKSALVKALTGTDPDRLPEEKARGITIDLGFAHLVLPGTSPLPSSFQIGIVDVPGHEDFVKNMVAGVGSIDLALLVVAADDGWMPQTEEHLQILSYLGVARAVVALNKIDLVQDQAGPVQQIRDRLSGTVFANAPMVPTSTITGRGLDELKLALTEMLAHATPPSDSGKPRLSIDRAFSLHGIGTVVTGTLIGGSLHRGQSVVIQPGGVSSRIRTLQSHGQEMEVVGPGTRTALSLTDLAVAQRGAADAQAVRRGQVVTLSDFGPASDTWDVLLERSPRSAQPAESTELGKALRDGAAVRVHHGSGHSPARVLFSKAKVLAAGESAVAQLRLDSQLFAFVGDRFVIRDRSEQITLAGGVILEADANRRLFRKPGQQSFLEGRAQAPANLAVAMATLLERDPICRSATVLVKSTFSVGEISRAVGQLQAAGKVVLVGDFIVEASYWNELRTKAIAAIDAHHQAHPEQPGLSLNALRSTLEGQAGSAEVANLVMASLARDGFVQSGTSLKRSSHRAALPPHLQAVGAKLRAALSAKPMEPPSRKELAPDAVGQQALRFLIQTGEAVEVGPDVVLLAETFGKAVGLVRKHLRERGPATVSDLRQVIGASRRIVVPLLEKLDREGVTRRQGDFRVLKA